MMVYFMNYIFGNPLLWKYVVVYNGTWGLHIINWYHLGLSTLLNICPNIFVKRAPGFYNHLR